MTCATAAVCCAILPRLTVALLAPALIIALFGRCSVSAAGADAPPWSDAAYGELHAPALDADGFAEPDAAERHQRMDVGTVQTSAQTGLSPPVTFVLPGSARAALVTLTGPAGAHLALSRWQSGGGPLLVVPGWVSGPHAPLLCTQGCTFRQSARPAQQVSLAPNAPLPVQLGGTNEVIVHAFAWDGAAAPKPVAAQVSVTVDVLHAQPLASGRLAVNVCLTGAAGLTAALARRHARLAEAIATVREIFAAVAIDIAVNYLDVPGPQFVVHDTNDAEISALFLSALGAPAGVNVFLVQELTYSDDGHALPMIGLSGGVPGPFGAAGTAQAGVVVALRLDAGQPDRLGVAIAHEIGHFLGLYHSSDPAAPDGTQLHDQLPDTGENDAANLMYWSPQPHSTKITAQQAAILRQSPWVQAN
ncbi:MAG: hypothetical protein FJ100_03575 [Deltaproteobacteria bacterium]|nr:hypothetical protein [Deltaproteobacteria bacterium]